MLLLLSLILKFWDLAEYDVNFVFSANSTTNRKIKICPSDGDNVTVFVMDELSILLMELLIKAIWTIFG